MDVRLNRLEEFLKKKGIGPEGSKSLKQEELSEIELLLSNDTYSLTTRATILTAILMLPSSEAEKIWLHNLRENYSTILPESLHFFLRRKLNQTPFEQFLCDTLEGKDLNYEEAAAAMTLLLTDASVPDFQKGAFLEAQRLKRESFAENKAFFDILWTHTARIETTLPVIIDICDNYDGFNRHYNLAPFFAAAIASCGYPCIVHGTDEVAPKYGVSSQKVLEACKGNISKLPADIVTQITDTDFGWGYLNQSHFHPALFALKKIRKEMVKRPFLATFEKIMQPIRAANGNYILTGFTHTHYRTEVAEQLKTQNKIAAAIVIKGLEGSSCPPLNRDTVQVIVSKNKITDQQINPADYLSEQHQQLPAKIMTAEMTAQLGLQALQGERNEAFYQIIYYTAMVLTGFELEEKLSILKKIETNLVSGNVYRHFSKNLL